eukprot:355539-Chlamydomonas_euryale.AAC.1
MRLLVHAHKGVGRGGRGAGRRTSPGGTRRGKKDITGEDEAREEGRHRGGRGAGRRTSQGRTGGRGKAEGSTVGAGVRGIEEQEGRGFTRISCEGGVCGGARKERLGQERDKAMWLRGNVVGSS